jgi:hypothetical protein
VVAAWGVVGAAAAVGFAVWSYRFYYLRAGDRQQQQQRKKHA